MATNSPLITAYHFDDILKKKKPMSVYSLKNQPAAPAQASTAGFSAPQAQPMSTTAQKTNVTSLSGRPVTGEYGSLNLSAPKENSTPAASYATPQGMASNTLVAENSMTPLQRAYGSFKTNPIQSNDDGITPLQRAYSYKYNPSPETPEEVTPLQRAYSYKYNPSPAKSEELTPFQRAYGFHDSDTPVEVPPVTANQGAYSDARQDALNQAETTYNKLLRYLPEYNELMGMRGLGVSEQSLLNAQNDYTQNLAKINAQYDEMEESNRPSRIASAKEAYGELSAFISGAGDALTQESYNRFKQGLLDAGYTEQELNAAEGLMSNSEYEMLQNAVNYIPESVTSDLKKQYGINGDGIFARTATEEDFGEYYDTGKEGTGQYQLVQDILEAARNGKIPNGTYVDFNYGKHKTYLLAGTGGTTYYVYYNGYFYPTIYKHNTLKNIRSKDVIGRYVDYKDPKDL